MAALLGLSSFVAVTRASLRIRARDAGPAILAPLLSDFSLRPTALIFQLVSLIEGAKFCASIIFERNCTKSSPLRPERCPWNARLDAGRLALVIPKESLWAYQSGGLEQVGCVYTAQGTEFDYVGVIVGQDLGELSDSINWTRIPTSCLACHPLTLPMGGSNEDPATHKRFWALRQTRATWNYLWYDGPTRRSKRI